MLDSLSKHTDSLKRYTELRQHRNRSRRLVMRKGSLIENRTTSLGGISARCHNGGGFGFASIPEDSDAAITRCLADSRDNAELAGSGRSGAPRALPETEPGRGSYDYRGDRPMSSDELVERVQAIDAMIAERYPGLVNRDILLNELAIEKALVTSEGAETYSLVPRAEMMIKLSMQANDGLVEVFHDYGGFGESRDHFDSLDWLPEALEDLHQQLRDKAEGTYSEAGYHDVILDPDVAGILAHEAVGHPCEADLVLGGSVAGDKLGQQIGSEKVNLVDFAGRGPDDAASIAIHVDDEGTPCRDVTIIEDGVLKAFLTNKETARALDMEPTGNARAFAFHDEPLVRMRNTAILPGDDKLEDMIASIDRGYYLKRSSNGQADATSEFMFGIACGYEIVDGRLGRAIRDTTISGVAFDMLKTVSMVGDRITWSKGGMCGKKQLIPVGMGGPAIRCKVTLGGR